MISALLPLASIINDKARTFHKGRWDWRQRLKTWREHNAGELIWFHAASLGEFEQGRPLIEKIKQQHPDKILLLTFFSPSGYEVRKNYQQVHGVFYLPIDTFKNARDFVQIICPNIAVFIKYEVWPNYFKALKSHGIQLIMISVNFRENQRFFRGVMRWWWNGVLKNCQQFFTQNERTTQLLLAAGHTNVITAGDTRYDRVFEVASHTSPPKELIEWKGIDKLLIAGSTWPDDDKYIFEVIQKMNGWKVLFFPHNLNQTQIEWILKNCKASRWSTRKQNSLAPYNTIVVDEIGWLNSAYGVADIAWIGGGFNKGIHNTLEAASWGVPVCFGPKFEKFEEAKKLLALNSAKSARNTDDFDCLITAMKDEPWRITAGATCRNFVFTNKGATGKIIAALLDEVNRQ